MATTQELLEQLVMETRATNTALQQINAGVTALLGLTSGNGEILAELTAALVDGKAKVAAPATSYQPQSHGGGNIETMTLEEVVVSVNDKGQPDYKGKGQPWAKFGVKIWPEMLPQLGIDAAKLAFGPNPVTPKLVYVLMRTGDDGKPRPQKITGLVAVQVAGAQPKADDEL